MFQKMNKQKKLNKTRQKKIQRVSGGKLNTRNQNKKISKNKKKFGKDFTAGGFAILK